MQGFSTKYQRSSLGNNSLIVGKTKKPHHEVCAFLFENQGAWCFGGSRHFAIPKEPGIQCPLTWENKEARSTAKSPFLFENPPKPKWGICVWKISERNLGLENNNIQTEKRKLIGAQLLHRAQLGVDEAQGGPSVPTGRASALGFRNKTEARSAYRLTLSDRNLLEPVQGLNKAPGISP